MVVSAKMLADRERKRLDIKKTIYRAILEQFSRKISNVAGLGGHECFVTTPNFLVGFPAYDVGIATLYLERQLVRLGYTVRRTLPTTLQVTWPKPVPSNHVTVIDHQHDELPTLANLHKTAQTIRAKKSYMK
jgi:Family of unknown function (DUF5759)